MTGKTDSDARVTRKARRYAKLAIDRFGMLDEGETVVVGVSGGADSLCLLHLLAWYNERRNKRWDIRPVHIDPGFDTWKPGLVERACRKLGFDCIVKNTNVPAKLRETGTDSCFFCARERRKTLFRTAARLGTRKVALAHNMDDVNETFLMNLFFASSGAAFVPYQKLFKGEIVIVRPLYYLDSNLVRTYLKTTGIRPVRNRCPHEKTGTRGQLRRFLGRLYKQDHRVRTNIFWGMHNLKPEYLPRAHDRQADKNRG